MPLKMNSFLSSFPPLFILLSAPLCHSLLFFYLFLFTTSAAADASVPSSGRIAHLRPSSKEETGGRQRHKDARKKNKKVSGPPAALAQATLPNWLGIVPSHQTASSSPDSLNSKGIWSTSLTAHLIVPTSPHLRALLPLAHRCGRTPLWKKIQSGMEEWRE